ncbi:RING finger and WD repeat domain-containing protein 2 [Entomortierella beljakovae]|nr:RING finger and WD repeat domain-containing protein 2 [Entomortierella beljakovae]
MENQPNTSSTINPNTDSTSTSSSQSSITLDTSTTSTPIINTISHTSSDSSTSSSQRDSILDAQHSSTIDNLLKNAKTTPGSSTSNNLTQRSVIRKRQRLIPTRTIIIDALKNSGVASSSKLAINLKSTKAVNSAQPPSSPVPVDLLTSVASDFHCPICRALMKETFLTHCGHSFCYLCITQHLSEKQDCPILNSIFERTAGLHDASIEREPRSKLKCDMVSQSDYTREEIDDLLLTLQAKKRKLDATDQQVELEVLMDFLRNTREQKEKALKDLNLQIQCLDNDMQRAQEKLDLLKQYSGNQTNQSLEEDDDDQLEIGGSAGVQVPNEASEEEDEAVPPQTGSKRSHSHLDRENKSDSSTGKLASEAITQSLKIAKQVNVNKKRVATHFEDLQRCYFDVSLNCNSSIVSSIEFDRDDEYFATAGVTKKIKIFEYGCIEKSGYAGASLREDDRTELYEGNELVRPSRYSANKKPITSILHYPVREMMCRSKISSDYEGIVSLWDAQTGVNTLNYDEHEKRAWSVDFSRTDPTRLASGSDDTKVKIWSTTQRASVCTIESKANICCVKFNPESSHHIAFGSADHHIHYYDLRKADEPLHVFKGHRKAVSYVKFLGRDELVSASTDSTLKLWNTVRLNCARTYTGHVNEKNFVGLSASGDWISCGSENNAVYTYYKELRDPVVTVKFGNSNPVTGEDTADEDPTQFVSSVCWKKNTSNNILLAANSSGVIKVLELV